MAAVWVGETEDGKSIYRNDDGTYTYGSDASGWTTTQFMPKPKGAAAAAQPAQSVNGKSYTATTVLPGYASTDYSGSYDEWFERTVAAMVDNYVNGVGQTSGFSDPALGAPNEGDFGSGTDGKTGTVSLQTRRFFEQYVRMYGASDPWITQNFGSPPSRSATYSPDPNTDAALQDDRQTFETEENAKDRAHEMAIAEGNWANTWKIAAMEDATRRYIAEGDWGVQKYVAELQESGAMERLQLELGFRREELGQRALEERQRHHESMVALTLEVAKYDAELGAQPRNWLKYASWLQNRGEVVNGLNLATAAALVPENQIAPGEAGDVPGGALAGAQDAMSGQYQVAGIDLNSTDYSGMANQLLGVNTQAAAGPPSLEELNAVSGTLQTSGQPMPAPPPTQQTQAAASVPQAAAAFAGLDQVGQDSGKVGFRAYGGPTVNRLGMNIQPSGHKEVYSKFKRLLPSQQEMRMGEVESIGRYSPDFLAEMERSRPKGRAAGSAAFG